MVGCVENSVLPKMEFSLSLNLLLRNGNIYKGFTDYSSMAGRENERNCLFLW